MDELSKRISALNGVKGWFIFLVVIYHTFNGTGYIAHILSQIKLYGGYIVNYLFFMLSGFLTAYSFSKKKLSDRHFLDYIKNKLIKLYPLYAITNLLQLSYNIFINGYGMFNLSFLILVLTMQTGGALTDLYPYNFPVWFLCTLMVCYVVHYIIRFLCKDDLKKYIWCFYALFILGIILETFNLNIPFLYAHDGEGFTNFFLGSILFEHYHLVRDKKSLLYILWLGVLFCLIYPPARVLISGVKYLITIIFCPVIIILVLEEHFLIKFFCCKLSQMLGKISISVFVLHKVEPLSIIPLFFSNYSVGYAIYILALIGISSMTTYLMNVITSGERKPVLNLSNNSLEPD